MPYFSINHEDRVRLRHMLDAALEIRQYVINSTRRDLDSDRKLVHSFVRLFEIIGEAASQVSDELREDVDEIPWFIIIGMRNRLVHAYFSINLDVIWETSTKDIPPLIEVLERILR